MYLSIAENVNTVEKLTFRKCSNFDDTCMSYLVDNCGESLQTLEIISCGNLTVKGLENIANFRYDHLKTIVARSTMCILTLEYIDVISSYRECLQVIRGFQGNIHLFGGTF